MLPGSYRQPFYLWNCVLLGHNIRSFGPCQWNPQLIEHNGAAVGSVRLRSLEQWCWDLTEHYQCSLDLQGDTDCDCTWGAWDLEVSPSIGWIY
jgi:hypothetical protein